MYTKLVLIASFLLVARTRAETDGIAIYHPLCTEDGSYRISAKQCQQAIGKALMTGGTTTAPIMGCQDVVVENQCAISLCDATNSRASISYQTLAFIAQDIHSNCEQYIMTAGAVEARGLSADDRSMTVTVHLGKLGKGRPGGKLKRDGFVARRRLFPSMLDQRSEDEFPGSSSNEPTLVSRVERDFLIRPGLHLEFAAAEGDNQAPDAYTLQGVANNLHYNWNTGGNVRNAIARQPSEDGGQRYTYAITFAAEDNHDVYDVDDEDRWAAINAFLSFHNQNNYPRFFTCRLWSGDVVLGWFGWNLAPFNEREIL